MMCMVCAKNAQDDDALCKRCRESVRASLEADKKEAARMGMDIIEYLNMKSKFLFP